MAPRGRSAAPGLPQNNRLEIGNSLLYWGSLSVHGAIGIPEKIWRLSRSSTSAAH